MKRTWVGAVALAACSVVTAIAGGSAGAAPERVNGHFALQAAFGPECDSPVGVCMTGSVDGRIKGLFSFTATSIIPTDDTPATAAIVTAGDATVEMTDGSILCKLTGTLQTRGDWPFVSLCVITGGTGAWATADGYLRTSGTFTLDNGGGGSYDGRVTLG